MKKSVTAIMLLFTIISMAVASERDSLKIDSLSNVFSSSKDPIERLTAARSMAKMTYQSKPEQTLLLTKSASKLLDSLHSAGTIPDSTWLSFKVSYLHYSSIAFSNLGDKHAEMDAAMERLRIVQQYGMRQRESTALIAIGNIYMDLGHHDEARDYYERAMKIDEEIGEPLNIGLVLGNIVSTMGYGQLDTNLKYYNRSLELILKSTKPERDATAAWMMGNISEIYWRKGDLEAALKYAENSLAIRRKIDHRLGQYDALNQIAELLLKLGRLDEALKNINESILISESNGFRDNYGCYETRSKILAKQGRYAAALNDHIRFMQLRDSIVNEGNTKQFVQQTMRYEYGRQLLTDSLEFAKKEAVLNERTEKQRIGLFATAGGLILLLALAYSIYKGKKRSDELLLNILPEETAQELKQKGHADAKHFNEVTVLFTDFKNFTQISEKLSAQELVNEIDYCYSAFDNIVTKHGIEKIKTIGDAYMCAGGLPVINKTNAEDTVRAALDMRDFIEREKQKKIEQGLPFFETRIGCHTGPVVAGIVGIKKFAYDIWGDTVNTAARMESSGEAGKINISGNTYELVKDKFNCTHRGKIQAKNKGEIDMYFVERV